MNDNCLDMDWTENQGLSDSDLMNISNGCGYDITIGANNGEEIRRAYNTLPWKSDYEINNTDEQEENIDKNKDKDKYVDLGLPSGLLWAKCNLGANLPEESGKYYQWGDTEGYYRDQIGGKEGKRFSWGTYKYCGGFDPKSGDPLLTKYCNNPVFGLDRYVDDLDALEPSDDAATSELGNKWRIPTSEDFDELLDLRHEVTTLNHIPGVRFIGNNGNELFIPFSGYAENDEILEKDSSCDLWSSDLQLKACISSLYLSYSFKGSYNIGDYARCIGNPIRPVNISKLKKKFEINAEPNNSFAGSIIEGIGDYYEGDTCTLTARANKGYLFINWTKDGEVVSENSKYSFIVNEDATYIANFGVSILTQSDPVEGGTTSGGRDYVIGDTCTLVATPMNGYVFQNWKKQASKPIIVSTDPTYTFRVIATRKENSGGTYIANFSVPQYTITTSSNPKAGGSVSGGGTYNKNSTCTLVAIPNNGYAFENWTENGTIVSSESTYSFTVTGDRDIVANFTLQSYNIEVTVNDESRGTASGAGTYTYGSNCTLVAAPNSSDYVFENWTENGNVVSSESTYSFTVSGNRNIVANFANLYNTITVSSSDNNGSVYIGDTPGTLQETFEYGQTCTIHSLANNGYVFNNLTENGNVVTDLTTYTFTVTDSRTLVANFMEDRYLTFTANQDGSSIGFKEVKYGREPLNVVLQYSIDNCSTWNDYTIAESNNEVSLITLDTGDSVKFRGINPGGLVIYIGRTNYTYTNCILNGSISASGDVTSLINNVGGDVELSSHCYYYMFKNCTSLTQAPELPSTHLADYCYSYMFYGCTGLVEAPQLPSTTLANNCYQYMFTDCISLTQAPILPATTLVNGCYGAMFGGCTGLVEAPQLPATTLASYCYNDMFNGCTGLVEAPQLPATTLASHCYFYMFAGCNKLVEAPELPATTLADNCYAYMFYGCTSLTQAPELPAITLANDCYAYMFKNCTSLTQAPELPATNLANSCYYNMFKGCTKLVEASELPATTLAGNCYSNMFSGCTSLTQAPELPATTLANNCYAYMFNGCTSLTQAPELPAISLANYCYSYMFYKCTGLVEAPELPATTLANNCYQYMFSGCTSLNYIKCLATDVSATNCTANWVTGVSGSGTFIKDPNMNSWTTGTDGIPEGWTVQDNV